MTTFDTGREAENVAAEYLQSHGYTILTQNWRNRWCEIDIVAEKSGVVSFVEVKYRKSDAYGSGLEYITPKKLAQMGLAANHWMTEQAHAGGYVLAAVEVSGSNFTVTNFVESVT